MRNLSEQRLVSSRSIGLDDIPCKEDGGVDEVLGVGGLGEVGGAVEDDERAVGVFLVVHHRAEVARFEHSVGGTGRPCDFGPAPDQPIIALTVIPIIMPRLGDDFNVPDLNTMVIVLPYTRVVEEEVEDVLWRGVDDAHGLDHGMFLSRYYIPGRQIRRRLFKELLPYLYSLFFVHKSPL